MIGEVQKALFNFYKSFGYNAYPQGNVPDGATLPYFTFNALLGDTFSQEMQELYFWCDKTKEGNEMIASVTDAVFERLQFGEVISIDDKNKLWVQRNGSFAQFGNDFEDEETQFVRLSLTVDFFIN